MLLVDTNVILDVVENDPQWAAWSQTQLEAASLKFTLVINPVIYAELSIAYRRIEELEAMLEGAQLRIDPIPREALFLAGRVFLEYRQRKGTKSGVLPDFFVGAHAAVADIPLLTRDLGRYRTYFPSLKLITPEQKR
ncbi:MAG: type II toxin-antitoxin system VapC family toxin [Betaproteobacteria bacterium]|nr:type II toxin-antitoxin system VapC family toxin [Betaproteobacteria bacterium]